MVLHNVNLYVLWCWCTYVSSFYKMITNIIVKFSYKYGEVLSHVKADSINSENVVVNKSV